MQARELQYHLQGVLTAFPVVIRVVGAVTFGPLFVLSILLLLAQFDPGSQVTVLHNTADRLRNV